MSEKEKLQPSTPEPESHVEQDETREHMPEIKYQFYFSPHVSKVDARGLPELFQGADIFIPETAGWSQETLDAMRLLSDGTITVDEFKEKIKGWQFTEWHDAFASMIEGSKKKILFADVPKEHEFVEQYKELRKEGMAIFDPKDKTFDEMLSRSKNFYKEFTALQEAREAYMVEQLKTSVNMYVSNDASLQNKDEVKVLAALGASHTPVKYALKDDGLAVESNFSELPLVFSFRGEAQRRVDADLEVDDTLAARSWIEVIIARMLGGAHIQDSHVELQLERLLTSQLSLEDIRELFQKAHDKIALKPEIERMLSKKGFTIPRNEEEAKALIGKK